MSSRKKLSKFNQKRCLNRLLEEIDYVSIKSEHLDNIRDINMARTYILRALGYKTIESRK